LYTLLGNEWYAYDKFTYIGNKNVFFSNNVSKLELTYSQLNVWLNHILLPELDRREQERVMRVLPPSISFNINDISEAVWILECEETFKQGTAFMLESYGLITCEHVLGTNTHAFQANNHNKKYPVRVVAKHEVIDIAILEIDAPSTVFLKKGSTENLKQLDPIAVFGFPNYNWGDTGNILSGHISGFKMVSAIRRILVNTPLIQGNSGSPIINNKNEVIGIAVTGADRMENAQNTENHGVIPIDALDLIIQKK
jgi:S1-C subfamily serine protease